MKTANAATAHIAPAITVKHGGKRLHKRRSTGKAVGGQPGRRNQWKGKALPKYPEQSELVRSTDKPQPSLKELAAALSAPHSNDFATVWLQRLAQRDTARFKAITSAWATAGRSGLVGLVYTSTKPCPKCSSTHRIALSGRCQACYNSVRFGKPTVQTEQAIAAKAQEKQQRESLELLQQSGTEYAEHPEPGHWSARIGAETNGKLQLRLQGAGRGAWISESQLRPADLRQLLSHPETFALYQWATNNQPAPAGYIITTR